MRIRLLKNGQIPMYFIMKMMAIITQPDLTMKKI